MTPDNAKAIMKLIGTIPVYTIFELNALDAVAELSREASIAQHTHEVPPEEVTPFRLVCPPESGNLYYVQMIRAIRFLTDDMGLADAKAAVDEAIANCPPDCQWSIGPFTFHGSKQQLLDSLVEDATVRDMVRC